MSTNSIFFKIRVAFAISSFLILTVFALVYFIFEHYHAMEQKERVMHAVRIVKHFYDEPDVMAEKLAALELVKVLPPWSDPPKKRELATVGVATIFSFEYNGANYLLSKHPKGELLFLDKKERFNIGIVLLAAFALVIVVLSLFYSSILKGLMPLARLTKRVEEFAFGEEFLEEKNKHCDEIAALYDAFYKSAAHIRNISKARTLFLRNIAHELKTPISKGRFLAEAVEDESLRERLHELFCKLDTLINELLQMERITASGIVLNKKEHLLQDIIDEAVDSAFLDLESIAMDECNKKVVVDFKLFTLAVKNLISNGIKYSTDKKVALVFKNGYLCVQNRGEPLSKGVDELIEPFVKGSESFDGMGLGLYIVHQILQLHGTKFVYDYADGVHSFCIGIDSVETSTSQ